MTHEHDPASPSTESTTPLEEARQRLEQRKKAAADSAMAAEATAEAARQDIRTLLETCDEQTLETVLMQQGHLMNSLLLRALDTHAGPRLSAHALELIIKTQRECRQTVQALARVREANIRIGKIDRAKISGKRTDSAGRMERPVKKPDRLYDEDGRLIFDFSKGDPDGCPALD
jgi:hypothetical protein